MTLEVSAETVYVSMLICVFQDPPLPACLSMNLVHNHQLRCAEALRELRLTDNTRQSFDSYFAVADGLFPAQAMSSHESKLMVNILPVVVHLHCSFFFHYPRRARSALGVDTVLTLDVCLYVSMLVL